MDALILVENTHHMYNLVFATDLQNFPIQLWNCEICSFAYENLPNELLEVVRVMYQETRIGNLVDGDASLSCIMRLRDRVMWFNWRVGMKSCWMNCLQGRCGCMEVLLLSSMRLQDRVMWFNWHVGMKSCRMNCPQARCGCIEVLFMQFRVHEGKKYRLIFF